MEQGDKGDFDALKRAVDNNKLLSLKISRQSQSVFTYLICFVGYTDYYLLHVVRDQHRIQSVPSFVLGRTLKTLFLQRSRKAKD